MAKTKIDIDALCSEIISDVKNKNFRPVYLLMGTESFYIDKVCDAIVDNALEEYERDFNQIICYGSDVDVDTVVSTAMRFPMMADRQLVVVKEAQMMKDVEGFAAYCERPLESTVLVICMKGKTADKRKAFYKAVGKHGVVVESNQLRDYEMPGWISTYFRKRGLNISPDAAALFAEHAGVDMNKIAVETDKMLKNLPEGVKEITLKDIQENVGAGRQYSIFELTKALSFKDSARALKLATNIGSSHGFNMTPAISALFLHFDRILRYGALLAQTKYPSPADKAAILKGVHPGFYSEYDRAVYNYPVRKAMSIISLLKDYDYRAKGGDGVAEKEQELLVELVAKILN